ncbi:hypothetical protein QOZ80_3BG0258630 [Eleusine coracana subsp. coracana]|nr:hypothetical protein QOZ80_3BG0258630 [Eleusine coracana subsp. coracana]
MIPLCMLTMEMGSELSKTVATFIVQKIMLDDKGFRYMCETSHRYVALAIVLAQMVDSAEHHSPRLLKHIIRCYHRLTDDASACSILHKYLPISLINGTVNKYLQDDLTMGLLQQLVYRVNSASRGPHTGLAHMMGM